ncbi:MAG: hypothetical protein Q4B26_03760 [Eubacteriales bacterium]|nr:hypothetical protein [Eubacteriales bacterium]
MRNKDERLRMEGMAQAYRIVKKSGVDGLEAEMKMRNITGLPCAVSKKALDECVENIKNNVVDTFTILTVYVLHNKWGFGKQRMQRFIDDMNFQAGCLEEDYITWGDLQKVMAEECGMDLRIRKNDKDVKAG